MYDYIETTCFSTYDEIPSVLKQLHVFKTYLTDHPNATITLESEGARKKDKQFIQSTKEFMECVKDSHIL